MVPSARASAWMPAQAPGVHRYAAWLASGGLEAHVGGLLAYLERNQGALVHYVADRRYPGFRPTNGDEGVALEP